MKYVQRYAKVAEIVTGRGDRDRVDETRNEFKNEEVQKIVESTRYLQFTSLQLSSFDFNQTARFLEFSNSFCDINFDMKIMIDLSLSSNLTNVCNQFLF